jgi:hypothetical protein
LEFGNVILLFLGYSGLVQCSGPVHADSRLFDLDIAAGAGFNIKRTVFIHFIDSAMDTGYSHDLIASLQIFDKLFLVLGFFRLGADEEKPENKDHQSQENKLKASETSLGLCLEQINNVHSALILLF